MKHPWRWVGVVVAVVFVALLPSSIVIVNGTDEADQQASEQFDPTTFVEGIWASKLLPTVEKNAEELATVLGAIEVDADGNADKEQLTGVTEQYGTITDGEAHVYLVRGEGTITAVSDTGLATVELDGYEGPIEVQMYVGTRIPSDETSVRDGVGFIGFGDFKDQTDYGKAGSEINKRIVTEVLAPFAGTDLVGQHISFLGAMGVRTFNQVAIDMSSIRIVPVKIELD